MEINRYAVVDGKSGLVVNTTLWDGESEWTCGAGLVVIPSDEAGIGWSYNGENFTAPPEPEPIPPTPEQILAINRAIRDRLLAEATLAMAPLQDAVYLDKATPDEVSTLEGWMEYRVAINRVNLAENLPEWPGLPR